MDASILDQMEKLQPKVHGMAIGMTLGLSTMFLSQGCVTSGL